MSLKNIVQLRRYEKALRGYCSNTLDYGYKSMILNNSLHKAVNRLSLSNHLNIVSDFTGEYYARSMSDTNIDYWFDSLADRFGFCAILEAQRINDATRYRTFRLKRRVSSIISYPSLFLTLTFTNKVFQTTSLETRRKYVTRFLKSISNNYVGNIDFGSQRGREHYHALVVCDSVSHKSWKYGAINFKRVASEEITSKDKLAEYISKLTNHAIKKTTRRYHLIYPKKKS